MLLSNSLFLDESYLFDCANKIDYIRYIYNSDMGGKLSKEVPNKGSFIKINETIYKKLQSE